MTFLGSDIGSGFGEQGGILPPRIPRSTPGFKDKDMVSCIKAIRFAFYKLTKIK